MTAQGSMAMSNEAAAAGGDQSFVGARHLNETDLALVNALQINPRAPWSLIGETLGIGASTAVRRWQRLVDSGSAWLSAFPGGDLARRLGLAFAQVTCAPGRQIEVARAIAG